MARRMMIVCDLCGADITGSGIPSISVPIIDAYRRHGCLGKYHEYTAVELDVCEECLDKITVVELPCVGGYKWRED